jgi:hypothetical protein
MATYTVHWTIEEWYRMDIEANSEEEAYEKFMEHDFDYDDGKHVGSELQDSVMVEERKE